MAYEFEKLQVTLEDGVLTVLLNNPPANALGQPVVRDISGMLDLAETDDNVRVIVIAGTGDKLFSAGADIGEFAGLQSGTIPKYDGNTIFRRIETFPKSSSRPCRARPLAAAWSCPFAAICGL